MLKKSRFRKYGLSNTENLSHHHLTSNRVDDEHDLSRSRGANQIFGKFKGAARTYIHEILNFAKGTLKIYEQISVPQDSPDIQDYNRINLI